METGASKPAGEVSTTRRRRSRNRKRRENEARVVAYLHSRHARRHLTLLVALVLLGWIGIVMAQVTRASSGYAQINLSMTRAELQQAMGAPESGPSSRDDWFYPAGKAQLLARFSNGQVSEIRCIVPEDAMTGCPTVLGIGSGSSEAEVLAALGAPDSRRAAEDHLLLEYRGIGFTFRLHQAVVSGVIHTAPQGGMSWLRTAAWRAIP